MTQNSSVWTGVGVGDAANAPYSADEWAHLWNLQHEVGSLFPNYGVLRGSGDGTYEPLAVIASGAANVDVEIGAALVAGKLWETDVAVSKTVGANISGNPRIDTVILRVDYIAQTVRPIILQGTPAVSPARPSLTQNTTTYEMPLADIAVANGFSTISQTDITQRQRYVHTSPLGWMPYAYPLNYQVGGNYDSASHSISSNAAVAVPVFVPGNLLLESITVRNASGTTTITPTWALYMQDVNEGNTGEKTLRRIVNGAPGNVSVAPTTNYTFAASSPPYALPPGLYWLVLKNANSGALAIGKLTGTGFDANVNSYIVNTGPTLGQTLDMVTSWTKQTGSLAIRLNGRVFGQTALF